MSGEPHHALVDELERDLREALSLEPSPDFVRQVRARIEERSDQRARHALPWQLAAAAAVCVLTIGVAWQLARDTARPSPEFTTRVGRDVTLEAADTSGVRPENRAVRLRVPVIKSRERVAAVPVAAGGVLTREPEIIVPPDRARGVARLLALARSGEMDEERSRPVVATSLPETLDVEPLVVPSISIPLVDIKTAAPGGAIDRE